MVIEEDMMNEFIVQVKITEILKLDKKGIFITCDVVISGKIKASKNINASGDIHAGWDVTASVSLNQHTLSCRQQHGRKTEKNMLKDMEFPRSI